MIRLFIALKVRDMKKNRIYSFGIGTTSILMVFIIISLTSIALLSYMVTVKDSELIQKKIEYSLKYQSADNIAVDKMGEIDNKLVRISEEELKFDSDDTKKILCKIKDINVDYKLNTINYYVLLNDSTHLYVELKVNTNKKDNVKKDNRIDIKTWKLVNKSQNIEEDKLELWMN